MLGELKQYLNIQIEHDRDSKTVYLCQENYIDAMVQNFSHVVAENSSVITPMLENLKLLTTEEEMLTAEQSQFVVTLLYCQLIGANLYGNVYTRPAISQAVSVLAQFNNSPTLQACLALV